MKNNARQELKESIEVISSIINRSKNAQKKFMIGTSQHTLQKNRIKTLNTALFLIREELAESAETEIYTREDLKAGFAPLKSLISKSEKAQTKLTPGTWQHTMLGDNLKALHIALSLWDYHIN